METAKDLNFGSDDMQVVLTALHDVVRRIREVAETHKPLFGGEHFLTGKEVCERLYISPRTLQDYRDKGIIPYTQFAGRYSIRFQIWRGYWRKIIKHNNFSTPLFVIKSKNTSVSSSFYTFV